MGTADETFDDEPVTPAQTELNIDEAHLVAYSPGGGRWANAGSLRDHLIDEHRMRRSAADLLDDRGLIERHRLVHSVDATLATVEATPFVSILERAYINRTTGKIYVLDVASDELRRYSGGMATFACPMSSLADVGIDPADLVEMTPVEAHLAPADEFESRPSCRVRLMSLPNARMGMVSPFTQKEIGRAFVLVVDMADDVSEAAQQRWKARAADMGADALIFEAGCVHLD